MYWTSPPQLTNNKNTNANFKGLYRRKGYKDWLYIHLVLHPTAIYYRHCGDDITYWVRYIYQHINTA